MKLHRKIKHNEKVCRAQELGSYAQGQGSLAVFKVTARDQGHYKGHSGAFVTYCNISCSRRAVVSYWRKYVHEVLVNRLGGLSLPRKSVVRLTDRPEMTLDVYCGRKTTIQQIRPGFATTITGNYKKTMHNNP